MTKKEVVEQVRIIAIGDIHGRDDWKKIVEAEPTSTKEVFIGDYFDSWDSPFEDQLQNFNDILAYARENPTRVVLLIGNHDFQYLPGIGEQYSGFQFAHAAKIGTAILGAVDDFLLSVCYEKDGFLFSHAGVTKTWCEHSGIDIGKDDIPIMVNRALRECPQTLKFNRLDKSGSGEHVAQGPLWVRPKSLISDMIEGYVQVVGHTRMREITPSKKGPIFIDVFDTSREYLTITDGKPEAVSTI